MRTTTLLPLFLASFLVAQEDKAPPAGMPMPNPKSAAHDALAPFAGTWQCTMKSTAMPGVPGMETAHESTGTERSELVCNGLWLKSVADGEHGGKPCQGLWLLGHDPATKEYVGVMAAQDHPVATMKATYDAAAKTWNFTGDSAQGPFRSVLVWHGPDASTETVFMAIDGKETKCMEIARKRATGSKTTDASASVTKPKEKELAVLADGVGTWNAVVKSSVPDGVPTEDKGTEKIAPVCGGQWYWSDFTGTMMGQPFEGHALTGYDPAAKKYVSYWIDSMVPTLTRTEGDYDAAKKAFAMSGKCTGMDGQPMTIEQTMTQSPDARSLKMVMKSPAMTHEMQIDYVRASK